jgi:hypothetical protein
LGGKWLQGRGPGVRDFLTLPESWIWCGLQKSFRGYPKVADLLRSCRRSVPRERPPERPGRIVDPPTNFPRCFQPSRRCRYRPAPRTSTDPFLAPPRLEISSFFDPLNVVLYRLFGSFGSQNRTGSTLLAFFSNGASFWSDGHILVHSGCILEWSNE